ncbi:MAG: hypothetical protein RMK84_20395 [Oscillochloridaceae bacterium]|nr:hypothetical protein [Roseiflexaceae bacterium]MDW8392477.1 hypothetical protein [Oscillochloridaceae bacterium]
MASARAHDLLRRIAERAGLLERVQWHWVEHRRIEIKRQVQHSG